MEKKDYPKFSKKDCGRLMSLDEGRKIQLDMLNALSEYCDAHGLRYFLSGGTLLGAIRHKGYIPWDDDIDINMPRPDCEKLYKLTKGRLGDYVFAEPDMDGFAAGCESYRVYDFNTIIQTYLGGVAKKPRYHSIYIDVFPIEGLPDGRLRTVWHYIKVVFMRKMQRTSALKHMDAKNVFSHIFHVIAFVPAKLIGYRMWSRWLQKVATKYSFDEKDYVGVMTGPHKTEEKVRKKDYLETVEVLFEGKYYHAPGNYDTYLRQLYGDYMKMPPVEKRKSHHKYNMYWRK